MFLCTTGLLLTLNFTLRLAVTVFGFQDIVFLFRDKKEFKKKKTNDQGNWGITLCIATRGQLNTTRDKNFSMCTGKVSKPNVYVQIPEKFKVNDYKCLELNKFALHPLWQNIVLKLIKSICSFKNANKFWVDYLSNRLIELQKSSNMDKPISKKDSKQKFKYQPQRQNLWHKVGLQGNWSFCNWASLLWVL